MPDLLTEFALVAVVFTVTALISGLWSTPPLERETLDEEAILEVASLPPAPPLDNRKTERVGPTEG